MPNAKVTALDQDKGGATRPLNSNTFVDVPSPQILSGNVRQLYRFNAN